VNGFRDLMTARRASALRRALAALAGVLRHEDDPHVVRITITTPDGDHRLGSMCIGLAALTELVDSVRQRTVDLSREPQIGLPAPVLRMVPPGEPKA
jgi:hypothetical protein